jgi:hypothetical protein
VEEGHRQPDDPVPPPSRASRIAEVVLVTVGAALVALYAARPLYAVDLFWHLELGEVIAQTGARRP